VAAGRFERSDRAREVHRDPRLGWPISSSRSRVFVSRRSLESCAPIDVSGGRAHEYNVFDEGGIHRQRIRPKAAAAPAGRRLECGNNGASEVHDERTFPKGCREPVHSSDSRREFDRWQRVHPLYGGANLSRLFGWKRSGGVVLVALAALALGYLAFGHRLREAYWRWTFLATESLDEKERAAKALLDLGSTAVLPEILDRLETLPPPDVNGGSPLQEYVMKLLELEPQATLRILEDRFTERPAHRRVIGDILYAIVTSNRIAKDVGRQPIHLDLAVLTPMVETLLADPDVYLEQCGAAGLWLLGDSALEIARRALTSGSPSTRVQVAAVMQFHQAFREALASELLDLMRSQDAEVRVAAIVALERSTSRRAEVIAACRERLLDPATGVEERLRVLDAIETFQDRSPETLAALEKLRNHPDSYVRATAIRLLERKG
jgi:hypothetical protein